MTRSGRSSAGTSTANKSRVAQLTAQLNLDEPLPVRYLHWLGGLFQGDMGTSLANQQPVSEQIGPTVLNTLVLVLLSALVMIPVAFGIAMISANYRRRRGDTIIQTVLLGLAGLPEFVIGILLIALFSTTVFHWLPAVTLTPTGGHPWDVPKTMILPVPRWCWRSRRTCPGSCAPPCSRCSTATTSSWRDSRASRRPVVMRKHALLNAVVPGIQVIALQLAWLAGGVVIVETLFNYPGIGFQLVDSVKNHDVPMVQALSMIIAAIYVGVNLVADLLSILLTPRARTAISG